VKISSLALNKIIRTKIKPKRFSLIIVDVDITDKQVISVRFLY
jgi:hypothetical protein